MIRRIGFTVALAASLSLLTSAAFAQDAEALKTRGNQAMMDLNYADAIEAYRASLAKNPSDVALHYNIGRAHQARGDYPAALDALLEFDHRAPPETRAKVPSLAQLITDVRGRVGELAIQCSVEVTKGTITVAGPSGVLAVMEGCATTPRKVRVSLPSKSVSLDVSLTSDAFAAPGVMTAVSGGAPPAVVRLSVVSRSNAGLLRVQATPASAIVSVDGAAKGNSPVELTLPAGAHVVDVVAEAYEKAHVPIVIEAGGRRELNLTLEKTPPITKRWWFWAGSVAAVAAVTTVVVILVVQPEREPTKGTIDPGVVSAPLVTF